MTTLEAITRFIVPTELADETDKQLRDAGIERVERFVLWSGQVDANTFSVRTVHVPKQTSYRLPGGLCVRVEGDELHRLNVWLFEHGERLGVQVHSHPTGAYHSDTDDAYPIVAVRGGVSIVVPFFGATGLRGPGVAWYRLSSFGWDEVSSSDASQLVRFEE